MPHCKYNYTQKMRLDDATLQTWVYDRTDRTMPLVGWGGTGRLLGRCLRLGTVLLQASASVLTDEHRTQTID